MSRKIFIWSMVTLLLITSVVFNRMYMEYRHENKHLKKIINNFYEINNGLKHSYTGTADKLKMLYNKTPLDCGSNIPAYECSGLFIHGLLLSEKESPFSHREIDRNKAVSFAYLRKDHKYKAIVNYSSGIILFPLSELKNGRYHVLCGYPIDGWTDSKRNNNNGCGNFKNDQVFFDKELSEKVKKYNLKLNSGDCVENEIKNVEDWIEYHKKNNYFTENNDVLTLYTCSFDLRNSKNNVYNFNLLTDIRKFIDNNPKYKPYYDNNEFLISSWDEYDPESLPVMAIFYTVSDFSSLSNALLYQRIFFDKTQRIIPIIGIKFPENNQDLAEYIEYVRD